MNEEFSYRFLQNIPIGEDLFEGKSQEKIACVISKNIEKGEFKIIGIDGGWGTGKSNLVKIIENKLAKESNKYEFFIYDVWGHQGDDQRKAILVELTDFITENKHIKDIKKWKEKLNKLLAREKEITTVNFPYLSVGFIFSLLSIIYIPTVNVFKDSITDFFEIKRLFWKLLLVMFPVFIVFAIYIFNFFKNWKKSGGFWESFKISAQETFQIYTNKQKEETKIETISEKEPSVRDFRTWMRDVDSDLKDNNKKLIIIFDNFDRLPPKNIQSIWSSIHIFFSEEKYNNIKVIIPFDRAHIKNAFGEFNNPNNDNHGKIDFANDYINKTFDIVFRISPPIMSAWKDFFRKCWNEAFNSKENEEEYIRVEQIYETHSKTNTPREIIAFINEIISIKLIHQNIPERFVGLFVINKYEILSDPLKAITEAKFLKGLEYLYKDTDDFQKYITALSYQIDPENALEVIYKKQLKDSLVNNNTERFKEISKTNIFNRIIYSTIAELDNFDNPILTLNSMGEDSTITPRQKQSLWDDIYLKTINKGKNVFEITEGEKILLVQVSLIYKEPLLKKIIESLLTNTNDFVSIKYAQAIDDLEKLIKENAIHLDIYKLLSSKSVSPKDFLEIVNDKKEKYKNYKISTNKTELDKYLSEQDVLFLESSGHLKYLKPDFSFGLFIESIKTKINENKTNPVTLSFLFQALKIVSDSKPKIDNLLADNEIYNLYTQITKEQDFYYDLVAMRIAKGVSFNPNYRATFTSILDQVDPETTNKISERIEYYILYGNLVINSLTFSSNLIKSIIRNRTEYGDNDQHANAKALIQNFEKICIINDLNPQIFINNLTRWPSPKFDKDFIETLSNYYIREAMENKSRLAKDTIAALTSYFDELSKEEWKNIFENLTDHLYECTEILKYSNWSGHSLEALKEVLTSLSQSESIENKEKLEALLLSFEKSGKDLTNTFKNIRDEFIENRNMDTNFFSFFSNWLFKYGFLEEKSGDVMRTILKAQLLDDEQCLAQLIKNQIKLKLLFENANSSEAFDFKEAIRDRWENPIIKSLAKVLEISKRKTKEEKELEEVVKEE